jgi:periplasmic protein TonB
MNTVASTLRSPHHFPGRPHTAATPVTGIQPAPAGSWRYQASPRHRWVYGAGLVLSVGVHTALFFGFSRDNSTASAPTAPQATEIIQIAMPDLPPEEPEAQPVELAEAAPAATVAVPQLMEVPSMVALSDFTQLADLRPQTEFDPAALRQMAIPVNHGRGGNAPANLGDVFRLGDLDRIPQAVAQPAPRYPHGARSAAEEESVLVSFIVDAEGAVLAPRAVSSTNRDFEDAAVQGVQRWKFRPGIKGGRKVATRMEVPVKFVVTDQI